MFYQPRWRSRQRHLCLSECLLTSPFDICYIIILYTVMSNKGICLSVCLSDNTIRPNSRYISISKNDVL